MYGRTEYAGGFNHFKNTLSSHVPIQSNFNKNTQVNAYGDPELKVKT